MQTASVAKFLLISPDRSYILFAGAEIRWIIYMQFCWKTVNSEMLLKHFNLADSDAYN